MNNLEILIKRLEKIGIKLELAANYPWIYLVKVNGKVVKEKYNSDHFYTIAMANLRSEEIKLLSNKELFQIIRKYK